MFFQPLPSYMPQISKRKGGNVLGLDSSGGGSPNAIIWNPAVSVSSGEADYALAQARLYAMAAQLRAYAASVGGLVDFVYMNYADGAEDVLGSYGAENVRFIGEVAARYDPEGVFQRRVPGGFKISRVR